MTTDPAITKLLERANSGDQEASARVWEATLAELRSLAVKRLSRDALARDLQPTELVDEVWIRMAGGKGGIAEAWAAEEEEMELMRDELEAAEQVVSVCAFARPRAAREGFRVCCCVRA